MQIYVGAFMLFVRSERLIRFSQRHETADVDNERATLFYFVKYVLK